MSRARTVWRRRTLVVAGVACGLAACGARQHPTPRHDDRAFGAIDVEGNGALGEDELLDGLASVRARELGRPFEPSLVRGDAERIRGQYVRRGYFAAAVETEIRRKGRSADVVFRVEEGARATLAAVDIEGLPPDIPRDEVREAIHLADGAPFDYEAYDLARPALVDELAQRGYAHATVDAAVEADPAAARARIKLSFEPGPKARFGEVKIIGVDPTLARAARRRLKFDQGDLYSTSLIQSSQEALYELGRFASVRIEPDLAGGRDVVPVEVTVLQAPRHELRLGFGVGIDPTSWQLRARSGYGVAGWPESLASTRVELRPALVYVRDSGETEPRIEATAGIERIDLFAPRVIGEVEGGFSYATVEAFTSLGPRVRLGLRRRLGIEQLQASAGWQLRVLEFSKIDPVIDEALAMDLGLRDRYRLGYFEQSLVLDLRDDPVNTRRGVYGELRAEEGTQAAGGEFDYLRLTPELRGYLPVRSVVLAARARTGGIAGDLPITQRYFSGGANSHRGFPERRLAPTVTGVVDEVERAVPYGGGGLLELSGELRAHVWTYRKIPIGGVLFLDGGDVTERYRDLDVTSLHWAVGLGVRLQTVIGAIRGDLGFRLNRLGPDQPRTDQRFAYHLSIGEAF